MQTEPKSSYVRAARPWLMGAIFVWTLTGAVAFAAYSSRSAPAPKVELAPEVSAPAPQNASATPPESDGKSIVWEADFESAMRRARLENKPLMIDFYTDWCGVCKTLDREVLPEKNVVTESRNWVSIKINAEKRPDVAGAYGVTGYPTLVFAEKSGKPLTILPGMAPAAEFLSIMKEARGKLKAGV